jgi:transcriptional regulator with XRE-family HTH domain
MSPRNPDFRAQAAALTRGLSEYVLQRRKELSLTQDALASLAGVSPRHVRTLEKGGSAPNLSTLVGLAHVFGVLPEELLAEARKRIPVTAA